MSTITERIQKSYIFQRFASAALIYSVSLYLARVLGEEKFGEVAFFLYFVKFMLTGQLGSVSGYILENYRNQEKTSVEDECLFLIGYSAHLIMIAICVFLIGLYIGKIYTLSAIAFTLTTPFFSLEPILRVRKYFYVSLLPDLILYVTILASLIIVKSFGHEALLNPESIILNSYLLIPISYIFLFSLVKETGIPFLNLCRAGASTKLIVKKYLNLIGAGFPAYLSTLAFSLLLFIDRFFLERYHSAAVLSSYMLGFQLCVGASLAITSKNFVSVVEIGEAYQREGSTKDIFWKQLRESTLIAIPAFAGLLAIAWIMQNHLLEGYATLFQSTCILGLGMMIFSISGSISPIVFFMKRQRVLTSAMMCFLVISLLGNTTVLYYQLSPNLLVFLTGLYLSVYGVFSICFSWNCSRVKYSS